jgi:cobalt-zinc-cadmium resistance protein CzcA
LEKGESDILEKTTAEQQKLNLSNQLAMLSKMKDYVTIHLNWLINDGGNYVPEVTSNESTYNILYDSTSINNHPAVLVTEQELLLAKSMTQVEKTDLLPEIMFGYRNVSIRGTGADNQVYGSSDRFSSFQVGFGLPLFTKGIRSSIQSAKIMEDIKTHEYNAKKGELLTKIQQQYVLYNETLQQVRSYEQKALPNAKTIRSVSDTQFSNGQINYLEYVMLTQQAIQIESEYLELQRNLNLIIIDLHYLTNH